MEPTIDIEREEAVMGVEYYPVVETLNSRIVVLDQYIVDIEENIKNLERQLATLRSSLAAKKADRGALQQYVDSLEIL